MKEKTKITIGALIAFLLLVCACKVFGQEMAANARISAPNYDTLKYYNINLVTLVDGKFDIDDSIKVFVTVRNSGNGRLFIVAEKTTVLLPYGYIYEFYVTKKGHTTSYISTTTGVAPQKNNFNIVVNLKTGDYTEDVGHLGYYMDTKRVVFTPYKSYCGVNK